MIDFALHKEDILSQEQEDAILVSCLIDPIRNWKEKSAKGKGSFVERAEAGFLKHKQRSSEGT